MAGQAEEEPPVMERPASSDPAEIAEDLWAGWGPGRLAFDVGANCGQSLPVLRRLFAGVVAFEPAHESWLVLQRDWFATPGVELVPFAISDEPGPVVDLYETPNNVAQGQLISPGHHAFTREVDQPKARPVQAMTLDAAAEQYGKPDFVKIDTEGHELRILQSGPELLGAKLPPEFLIEFHSPEMHDGCAALLEAAGLQVTTVRHPHYAPGNPDFYNHGWLRASR